MPIKGFLGVAYKGVETDWDYIAGQMSTLAAMFSNGISFGALVSYDDFATEQHIFSDYAQNLEKGFFHL